MNVRWQLYCGHTAQDRDTRPPQHRILHKRQGWDASPLMWSYMRTAQEAVKDSSSFCWNFHKCSLYLLATFDKESSPAAFNTSFATAEKFNSLLASVLKTGRTATGTQFPPPYQCCKRCWMEYLQTEGEMVLILNDWIILFYLYVPLLLVSSRYF